MKTVQLIAPAESMISEEAISKYSPLVAGTAAAGLGLWGLSKFMNKDKSPSVNSYEGYNDFYPQGY